MTGRCGASTRLALLRQIGDATIQASTRLTSTRSAFTRNGDGATPYGFARALQGAGRATQTFPVSSQRRPVLQSSSLTQAECNVPGSHRLGLGYLSLGMNRATQCPL
jgi:hypothetical protein